MPLEYESPELDGSVRYWLPLALFLACVAAGMAFGAATNAVNAMISPPYFQAVMRWRGTATEIQARSIMQGILEGGFFGVAFGAVYTIAAALITHCRCRFEVVFRYLLVAMLIACGLWIFGGACGAALAWIFPSRVEWAWFGLDRAGTARASWVGGSIWGAYTAGLTACFVAPAALRRHWKRRRSP